MYGATGLVTGETPYDDDPGRYKQRVRVLHAQRALLLSRARLGLRHSLVLSRMEGCRTWVEARRVWSRPLLLRFIGEGARELRVMSLSF